MKQICIYHCLNTLSYIQRAKSKHFIKDKKYGFGGKKRNSKRNTAKGLMDDRALPAMRKPGTANRKGPKGKGRKGGAKGKGNKNKNRSRK